MVRFGRSCELFKVSHIFGEMPWKLVTNSNSMVLIICDDD